MASVYTTKRGKTKKAKLGIRKDSNNNAANKLNCKISNPGKKPAAEAPINFAMKQELLLRQNGGVDNQTLSLTAKCSNLKCANKKSEETLKLSLCSACNSASYCCRECQVEHWPTHKVKCLEIRESKEDQSKIALNILTTQMKLLETQQLNNEANVEEDEDEEDEEDDE